MKGSSTLHNSDAAGTDGGADSSRYDAIYLLFNQHDNHSLPMPGGYDSLNKCNQPI